LPNRARATATVKLKGTTSDHGKDMNERKEMETGEGRKVSGQEKGTAMPLTGNDWNTTEKG